jgi:hypothetical protein
LRQIVARKDERLGKRCGPLGASSLISHFSLGFKVDNLVPVVLRSSI